MPPSGDGGQSRFPEPIPTAPQLDFSYESTTRLERIGRGGNADVYKVRVQTDDREHVVAIKEPRFQQETLHQDVIEQFIAEAETWANLDSHDHIVDVIEWDSAPLPWIALEYMDGGNLRERIDTIDVHEALWTGIDTASAIRYAHRHGVAHLDLKPENILFRQTDDEYWDVPKVSDWGLARLLLNQSQSVEGISPRYAAPEQFDPDTFGQPDDFTDIYQLGVVLYEALTGRPPFTGSAMEVMRATMEKSPPPATDLRPDLPEGTTEVLGTALEKRKVDRYESILDFRRALEELVETEDSDIGPGAVEERDYPAEKSRGDELRDKADDYLTAENFDRAIETYERARDVYDVARQAARESDSSDGGELSQLVREVETELENARHQQLEAELASLHSRAARAESRLEANAHEEAEQEFEALQTRLDELRETAHQHGFEDFEEEVTALQQRCRAGFRAIDQRESEDEPSDSSEATTGRRRTLLKLGGGMAVASGIGLATQGVFDGQPNGGNEISDGDGGGGVQDTPTPEDKPSGPVFQWGGELLATISTDVQEFDPIAQGWAWRKVLRPVYEGLMATDFRGRPQLYLAESIRFPSDTTVRIRLKEGITFHDHAALDDRTVRAGDVLSTFERYEGAVHERDVGEWYEFGSGTVLDDLTLEIDLTRPYGPLGFSIGVPIVPKEVAAGDINLSETPVGTGPYEFDEYQSGELVRLTKNEEYWVKDSPAFDDVSENFPQEGVLDAVTFRVITDESDQLAALRQGAIDLATSLPTGSIEALRGDDEFTVAQTTASRFTMLVYPMHGQAQTPFQNRKVRLATNRLIPRKNIISAAYDGIGQPAYAPISPALELFSPETLQDELREKYAGYDRETAQSLLQEGFAEAGFGTPFETAIVVSDRPHNEKLAEILRKSLEDTGFFNVEVKVHKFSNLIQEVLAEDSHTVNRLVALGWSGGWEPDGHVHNLFHSERATPDCCNINHYANGTVDDLIEKGVRTYDLEARASIYEDLQREIVRDSPVGFVRYHEDQSAFATDVVKNWTEYPVSAGDYAGIYAPYAGKFTWVDKGQ